MEWVELNGVALRYEVSGDGPKLLLIHELGGTLDSWDGVLPELRKHFRVLRFDQRGAGLSEKVNTLSLDDVLGDCEGILDAAGFVEPVAVAGTALGGGFALALAARSLHRVAKVVATSPATGVTGERGRGLLTRADTVVERGMRAAVESSLTLSFPKSLRDDAARYESYRARWLANDPNSFAALNRMLANTDMEWIFPTIECAALILGAS